MSDFKDVPEFIEVRFDGLGSLVALRAPAPWAALAVRSGSAQLASKASHVCFDPRARTSSSMARSNRARRRHLKGWEGRRRRCCHGHLRGGSLARIARVASTAEKPSRPRLPIHLGRADRQLTFVHILA
jgi:hypothetical protein